MSNGHTNRMVNEALVFWGEIPAQVLPSGVMLKNNNKNPHPPFLHIPWPPVARIFFSSSVDPTSLALFISVFQMAGALEWLTPTGLVLIVR